jgi:hypothetical protein
MRGGKGRNRLDGGGFEISISLSGDLVGLGDGFAGSIDEYATERECGSVRET